MFQDKEFILSMLIDISSSFVYFLPAIGINVLALLSVLLWFVVSIIVNISFSNSSNSFTSNRGVFLGRQAFSYPRYPEHQQPRVSESIPRLSMREALLLSGESDSDKQPMCLQLTSGSGEQTFQRSHSNECNEEEMNLSLPSVMTLYHGYVNTCQIFSYLAENICCVKGTGCILLRKISTLGFAAP